MNFNPKNEYDFLKNQDFVLWVNHQNKQDTERWHRWLQEHPDQTEYFHKAKAIINSFQYSGDERIDDTRLNTIREKLIALHDVQPKNISRFEKKNKATRWHYYKWAAASVALFFVLGVLSLTYLKIGKLQDSNTVKVSTERGERKNVRLPDGSSVTLDSYSSIEYLADFEDGRQVNLNGRAFFEVQKQNGKPFEVFSTEFEVKVLGTSFDMNTDQNRGNGHVALVTGKVNVKMESSEELALRPSQAAYINFEDNTISKGDFDDDQILGWRKNILKFIDEPYPIVFERIANWYGVEFIYDKNLQLEGLYSATYRNQKLDDVLEGLGYSSDLKFTIKSDQIHVSY